MINLDLANGSFGLGSGWVKFGSGTVRITQILFGLSLVRVKFKLIKFDFGSVSVRVKFGLR